jgi:hypothetical protein
MPPQDSEDEDTSTRRTVSWGILQIDDARACKRKKDGAIFIVADGRFNGTKVEVFFPFSEDARGELGLKALLALLNTGDVTAAAGASLKLAAFLTMLRSLPPIEAKGAIVERSMPRLEIDDVRKIDI